MRFRGAGRCQPPVLLPRSSVTPGAGFTFGRCLRQFRTLHVRHPEEEGSFSSLQCLLVGVKRRFQEEPLPSPPACRIPLTFH